MKSIGVFIILMLSLNRLPAGTPASGTRTTRVVFAQYCFWTGEMKLGQIDGVVRTEAGFFQGHEVTRVDYDPSRITLEALAARAREAGVADRIHLPAGRAQPAGHFIAGVPVGAMLDDSYSAAPASDQKKQLEGTAYARLKLTPEQATKVNAYARSNPGRAAQYLGPAQRQAIAAK